MEILKKHMKAYTEDIAPEIQGTRKGPSSDNFEVKPSILEVRHPGAVNVIAAFGGYVVAFTVLRT